MSIGEGMGKTLGIGVLIAGAIGALWLFKDQIAGWFGSAIAAPITGAVSGAVSGVTEAVSGVANIPILTVGNESLTVGEAARGLNPLTFVATTPGQLMVLAAGAVGNMFTSQPESAAPVSDTFVSAPQTIPTEADILWQAKLAEVGPVPSGPAPSGYQVRGSSLTGAPLYEPVQAMIGNLELPDAPGTVAQVWQLGPSKMLKVGDVWLGENISACYLGGGWWDAPRGRCIYGAG